MGCLALAEPLVIAAPHASVVPARPVRRLASAAPDVEALPDTGVRSRPDIQAAAVLDVTDGTVRGNAAREGKRSHLTFAYPLRR